MNRTRPTPLAQAARRLSLLLSAALLPAVVQAGPVSITDTSAGYSQNFNSLGGGNIAAWSNGTTLAGWYLFAAGGAYGGAVVSSSGGNTAGFFNYGALAGADRALGAVGFTSSAAPQQLVNGFIALALTNNTGTDISAFTLSYDAEQWRSGGSGRADHINVDYRVADTYANSGWTLAGPEFNATSLVTGTTPAVLNGNLAANRSAGLGGTVNTTWGAGETLWLRFSRNQIANSTNGDGLAIDNLSLSFTPATIDPPPGNDVPEPGSLALVAAGLAAAWARSRR